MRHPQEGGTQRGRGVPARALEMRLDHPHVSRHRAVLVHEAVLAGHVGSQQDPASLLHDVGVGRQVRHGLAAELEGLAGAEGALGRGGGVGVLWKVEINFGIVSKLIPWVFIPVHCTSFKVLKCLFTQLSF